MASLELFTLGTLDLRVDGEARPDVRARSKQIALLAFLAAERPIGFHSRDTLVALLWPESDERRARRSLRQAVYELRRELGTDCVTGHDAERIAIGDLWCDVRDFWSRIDSGDHRAAVELCKGDFLPGFHLGENGDEFESWMAGTRVAIRKAAVRSANALVEEALGSSDFATAVRWAEQTFEFAPYDEEALRRLLGIHEAAGNRPGAIQAYRRFAERLDRDLQMTPGEQTVELVRRLHEAGTEDDPTAGAGLWSGRARRPQTTGTDVFAGDASVGSEPAIHVPVSVSPTPASRVRGPRSLIVAGVTVVLVATAVWAAVKNARDSVPPVDPRRVLVTSFINQTADPDVDAIATLATDWMIEGATSLGVGDVVSEPSAAAARVLRGGQRPDTGAALAAVVGARMYITGSIYETADSFSVRAIVADGVDGNVIWASAETWARNADPGPALREVRDELLTAIAERIEPGIAALGSQHVDAPPRRDAYMAFSEGLRQLGTMGGNVPATVEFYRAHQLDTTFALPLVWAIIAHDNEYRMIGERGPRHEIQRDSLLALLQANRASLTTLELRFLDYAAARVARDDSAAYAAAGRLAQVASGPEYLKLIADAAHRRNRPGEVVAYLQAIDPAFEGVPADERRAGMLAVALHQLGDYETEYEIARRAKRLQHPDAITPWLAELRALAALDRRESIDSLLAHVDSVWTRFSRNLWADMLATTGYELQFHGRDGWQAYVERALGAFPQSPASNEQGTYTRLAVRFNALIALDRVTDLQAVADSFLALGGNEITWAWTPQGFAAAARGDTARVAEIMARVDDLNRPAAIVKARIYALLGDRDRAIEHLEAALRTGSDPGIAIHQDPAFWSMSDDPRFQRLMKEGPAPG